MKQYNGSIIKGLDSTIYINDTDISFLELGLNFFFELSSTNLNSSFYCILSNISISNITQNYKCISSVMNISNAQNFLLINSFFLSDTVCM